MPYAPGVTGELKVWRRNRWIPPKTLVVSMAGYFYPAAVPRRDHLRRLDHSAVEIEDAMLKHPDVLEARQSGPRRIARPVVKTFVVSATGWRYICREIEDLVRSRLSQHEYPRQIAFVTALPKTPAGKVNRKILRVREQAA